MHRNQTRVTPTEFDLTQAELTDEFIVAHPALVRYWLGQLVEALPDGIARIPDITGDALQLQTLRRLCFGFNRQHALTLLRSESVKFP